MTEGPVPRLDLAPRRRRPLALWNPLDYLVLLYWAFFFPQAIRWYLERFGKPEHQGAEGGRKVWQALRQDPVQSGLVVQALVSLVAGAFGISLAFQAAGVQAEPLLVAIIALGVFIGVVVGVAEGVAGGVGSGVGSGVAFGVAFGAAFGFDIGVAVGVAEGAAIGVAIGVGSGVVGGVSVGVVGGVVIGVAVGVANGVAFGVAEGVAEGAAIGVAVIVASSLATFRLPDWLLMAQFKQLKRVSWWSRMAVVPLPRVQQKIETWLDLAWTDGLANVREVLAYSLQFIPVVRAVEAALERSLPGELSCRVAELAEDPFDWQLVRFCSADLGQDLRRRAVGPFASISLTPARWRRPAKPRLDTPARAACAGFWFWHLEEPEDAVAAFEHVRHVRHGTELHLIARAIAELNQAQSLEQLVKVAATLESLESLPDPELRTGTLEALRTLRSAATEAATARRSRAPLNRAAALGRATAAINHLIEEGADICPYPEWPMIREIAETWRGIVAQAGGAVGEEVLRQPVPNPYEGYSGLPVTGPTFVGRRGAMRQIETRWATGDLLPVLILYGHRRMGKTSILRNLEQAAPGGTLLVYLDMQNAGLIDHTGQLLLDLAEAVHKRASAAGLDAGPAPAEADYASLGTARRALNALLDRLDASIGDRRLILAVDEFELIEEGIREGAIDARVLEYLRSLNQRHRWLALIFGGLHTLDEMGRDYRSAFYGQTEHVRVGYLNREDAVRLITRPHPDFALEYSDELLEELYRLTYGQPYLTQLLCWELVTRWNERFVDQGETTPRTLELEDLEPVIDADFFARAEYYFDGVWSNVSEEERALMRVMARREEGWPMAELAEASGSEPEERAASLELLRRHDVTVEEEGRVRFASELLRRWVAGRQRQNEASDAGTG